MFHETTGSRARKGFRFGVISTSLICLLTSCGSSGTAELPKTSASSAGLSQITGVVFNDTNANGNIDDGERPMADVPVFAVTDTGIEAGRAVTEENGQFQLAELPDSVPAYRIEAETPWPAPIGLAAKTSNLQRWGRATKVGTAVSIAIPPAKKCDPSSLRVSDRATQKGFCNSWLLPDMEPQLKAPSLDVEIEYPGVDRWYLDTTTQPGRTLLRIGTYAANIGAGPLHVIGLTPKGGVQPVVQRIYGLAGEFADRKSGTFVYHGSHKHIHLGRFEEYRLRRRSDGAVVAGGQKVSFCLTNVVTFTNPYPEFLDVSSLPGPQRLRLPLATMECGAKEQGINSGWADYYGPSLPDQWIDATGVPAGDYWIEIEVDPDNVLLESNEDNNVAQFPISLK